MTVNFKALILALALAVLPLRGIAAVAMWCCAQNQGAGVAAGHVDHGGGHHGNGHGSHHEQDAGHEHGQLPSPEPVAAYSASLDPPGDLHPPAPASACGGCVAGCVGGVVASATWASISFPPPGTCRIPFLEGRFTGIVPAQLERPPL